MKKYGISLIASLLSIVSCVNESIPRVDEIVDALEIKLHGYLELPMPTKADDKGFYDGDSFGVYITDYNNGEDTLKENGNQADNVRFVYDASSSRWIADETIYYQDPDRAVSMMAYYPYTENVDNPSAYSFEVARDQRTPAANGMIGGYEISDFLYASRRNVRPTSETISLLFRHQLSNMKVTLIKGAGWTDEEWNQVSKDVLVTNTVRQSLINLSDGSVSTVGDDRSFGIVPMLLSNDMWRAVVVPQVLPAGSSLLSITIDGVSREYVREAEYTYYCGKQNSLTLSVNKLADQQGFDLSLISEGITSWEDDAEIHDVKSKDYLVVKCPEGGKLKETIVGEGYKLGSIKNMKVEGALNSDDFYFMRDELPLLQALNLLEVRTVDCDYMNWSVADDVIPDNAFANKKSLMQVVFPSTLKGFGYCSFANSGLKGDIDIPEGVEMIYSGAFMELRLLNGTVRFPASIREISNSAFSNSTIRGDLDLPNGLEIIGHSAFGSTNISSVTLPQSLKSFSASFCNCQYLTGSIEIPAGIKEIPMECFSQCNRLNGNLILHEGLESIGRWAFDGCPLTGSLVLPSTVTDIDASAFRSASFDYIRFSESIAFIGSAAFSYSTSGNPFDLVVPDSVASISQNCFYGNQGIVGLHLGKNISTIDSGAFDSCFNIQSIVCDALVPPVLGADVFAGVAKDNFALEVPESSVELYQNAQGWNEFKRIVAHKDFSISRRLFRTLNAGETRTFVLRAESGASWRVESKPDWVSVTPTSGEGKAEIEVSVSALVKGEGPRSGEIVYSLDGTDYRVSTTVEQYDYQYGDGDTFSVQTHLKGNGVKLVFMGDCYDAKDISNGKYMENILEAVDHFFAIEPYNTYKDYFDISIVIGCSADSGIGDVNVIREAKFGSQYLLKGGVQLDEDVCWEYAVKSGDARYDIAGICLVLNADFKEGHTCLSDDDTFISACPVSRGEYPDDFRGVIQHEVGGHGFGKLGDEEVRHTYFIQTCPCDDGCPHVEEFNYAKLHGWYENLSLNGDFKKVPWAHLIYDDKYSGVVDVLEGGFYHARGVFRSENNSCMRTKIPYYSTISRESIVKRIMSYAGEDYSFESFKANDVTGAFIGTSSSNNR